MLKGLNFLVLTFAAILFFTSGYILGISQNMSQDIMSVQKQLDKR